MRALLQGEVLFPRLLRRYPGMALAGEPVYRSPGSTLRGLEHLPVYLRSSPAPQPLQVQVLESVPHGESLGRGLSCTA